MLNLRNVLSPHRSHPFPFHCVVDLTTWHYNSRQRNVVSNSQETFGEWTILYKIKKNKERGRLFLLLFRPMSSVKLRRDFRGMDYSVHKKTQYKHKGKTTKEQNLG